VSVGTTKMEGRYSTEDEEYASGYRTGYEDGYAISCKNCSEKIAFASSGSKIYKEAYDIGFNAGYLEGSKVIGRANEN